jgi:hypothetical protein
VCRCAARGIGFGHSVVFGAGDQDAFDRAIGRVADLEGSPAGGVDANWTVFVGEADDALRGAEAVEHVDREEFADDLDDIRAEQIGLVAAPHWGALKERDLVRRVVGHVGRSALGDPWMGLDQGCCMECFHPPGGEFHVEIAADMFPRDRVQRSGDGDVAISSDFRP